MDLCALSVWEGGAVIVVGQGAYGANLVLQVDLGRCARDAGSIVLAVPRARRVGHGLEKGLQVVMWLFDGDRLLYKGRPGHRHILVYLIELGFCAWAFHLFCTALIYQLLVGHPA